MSERRMWVVSVSKTIEFDMLVYAADEADARIVAEWNAGDDYDSWIGPDDFCAGNVIEVCTEEDVPSELRDCEAWTDGDVDDVPSLLEYLDREPTAPTDRDLEAAGQLTIMDQIAAGG